MKIAKVKLVVSTTAENFMDDITEAVNDEALAVEDIKYSTSSNSEGYITRYSALIIFNHKVR